MQRAGADIEFPQVVVPVAVGTKHDALTVDPDRLAIVLRAGSQRTQAGAVGIDHPDVPVAAAERLEHELFAVGAEARQAVVTDAVGDRFGLTASARQDP